MAIAAIKSRPDLSNRVLIASIAAAAAILVVYFGLARPVLPEAWRTPGSPQLYFTGVAGAALLLVSMVFVIVKRTGGGGAAPAWFVAHVVCATVGLVLVVVHSGGYLRRPPALMFLALSGLIALGVWARLQGARRMAATFATKQRSFQPVMGDRREELADVIAKKKVLLLEIDPAAREGTFSLTPGHWIKSPRAAWRYAKLVREENRLMDVRASVGLEQALWRPLHMVLGYLFVLGIFIHVITVTFFAGYVAGDGPIGWWHLAAW